MLLRRLTEYGRQHNAARPFYRDRLIAWQLNLDVDGRPLSADLQPLRDEANPKARGLQRSVPTAVRTVGVAPNLAADDVQYVLGWPDESTKPERVTQCHAAFVELVTRWAASPDGQRDPVAAALAGFYADNGLAQIARPESFAAKDGVVIRIGAVYAHESQTASAFWAEEVGRRKGSSREGLCLVCGQAGQLLDTVPGKIPARLVPGASNDAALVSVNEAVFGYGLATQLGSTPLCFSCGELVTSGLHALLDSEGSTSFGGQDSRFVWWVVGGVDTSVRELGKPHIHNVTALVQSLHGGPRQRQRRKEGKFYSLTVGGNVARVMVRDWVEMPLADVEENIARWFDDHEMVSPWNGDRFHSIGRFALVTGRWQRTRGHDMPGKRASGEYAPFGAKGSQRPNEIYRDLMRAALRGTPLPAFALTHLVNRIRTDGHVDDARVALLRVALTRSIAITDRERPMPTLEESSDNAAYVAGRIFAAYEQLQDDSNYQPRSTDGERTTARLNVTFADRYFAGAIANPRTALLNGARDSQAWLKKLHRRNIGAAINSQVRLRELYLLLNERDGLPARLTPADQARFVIGYHHQRAHQFASKTTKPDSAEETTR